MAPTRAIVADHVVPLVVVEAAALVCPAARPTLATVEHLSFARRIDSRGGKPQVAGEDPRAVGSIRGTSDLQNRPGLEKPAQLLGGKRSSRPLLVAFFDGGGIDVEHLGGTRLAARVHGTLGFGIERRITRDLLEEQLLVRSGRPEPRHGDRIHQPFADLIATASASSTVDSGLQRVAATESSSSAGKSDVGVSADGIPAPSRNRTSPRNAVSASRVAPAAARPARSLQRSRDTRDAAESRSARRRMP